MTKPRPAAWMGLGTLAALLLMTAPAPAGDEEGVAASLGARPEPLLSGELDTSHSELKPAIERFREDLGLLSRSLNQRSSKTRRERLDTFYRDWLARLEPVDFAALSRDGQVDTLLFRTHLEHERSELAHESERAESVAPLVPFADEIQALIEARARVERPDPKATADRLDELARKVREAREALASGGKKANGDGDSKEGPPAPSRSVANRAAAQVDDLKRSLDRWFRFYDGYDPLFSWWNAAPFKVLDGALGDYAGAIRSRLVGIKEGDDSTIVGNPIGDAALRTELVGALIPYTPDELIRIAEREMAWCEDELRKASRELGHGDDWKAALEVVKNRHLPPGEQPELVKKLADEAIAFLEARDLITIPALAKQTWRLQMMSPEAQRLNPFFLGGESIIVAFPTAVMSHDDKRMSLRGNNIHFARATVHHELIPGHNLQAFMTERYRTYRSPFATPFWTEGWALYWEMRLWDLGFPRSPEDRIGMLFWRMHRCARIVFSLSFHLDRMTPQECVDYLVDRVGHERANASAEVRRSFEGGYSPLYQCAYLLGGLQFRALHGELVSSGKMTERAFHDTILRLNSIPVELIRASMTDVPLSRDFQTSWRFYPLDDEAR